MLLKSRDCLRPRSELESSSSAVLTCILGTFVEGKSAMSSLSDVCARSKGGRRGS